MAPDFWCGKRVFLTGHTGFKGGWLSLWLQQLGAETTGFALPAPTKPSLFEVAKVGNGMNAMTGDIRDTTTFTSALKSARPDIVIHMAAQSLVRHSYEHPIETYSTNVMGVVNLFEAVRQTPSVRAVINVTTDKCYENREWHWGYRENEAMGGYDPYSSSKGCAELVSSAYRNSFFNPSKYAVHGVAIATARAGNVIGGGDWAKDRLIPDILRAIEQGEPVIIRDPQSIRPWQHVLEPLSGYLTLAEKLYTHGPAFAEPWNFGPSDDDAKSVQWIVERLTNLWDNNASWVPDNAQRPHEAHYLKLDCSKAKALLNWQPQWGLSQALAKITDWHRDYMAGSDMHQTTLGQIQTYTKTMSNT